MYASGLSWFVTNGQVAGESLFYQMNLFITRRQREFL